MKINKKHHKNVLTRRMLADELAAKIDQCEKLKDDFMAMQIEMAKLRNQILEEAKMHLRNVGLKLSLESAKSGRRVLRVEYAEAAEEFHSPVEFADMVARQVKHEIMRQWPCGDTFFAKGEFKP